MLRAAAFILAVTFAAGQALPSLCNWRCTSGSAAAVGCGHDQSATAVRSIDPEACLPDSLATFPAKLKQDAARNELLAPLTAVASLRPDVTAELVTGPLRGSDLPPPTQRPALRI